MTDRERIIREWCASGLPISHLDAALERERGDRLDALGRDYSIDFDSPAARDMLRREVRREALEEAARVCEDYADAFDANPVGGLAPGRVAGAEDCAELIRALIDAPR